MGICNNVLKTQCITSVLIFSLKNYYADLIYILKFRTSFYKYWSQKLQLNNTFQNYTLIFTQTDNESELKKKKKKYVLGYKNRINRLDRG